MSNAMTVKGRTGIPDGPCRAGRSRGGIVMCQTMWRCPDCGGRMPAREQWDHQCGQEASSDE